MPEPEKPDRTPAHPLLEAGNRANLLIISVEVNGNTASVPTEANFCAFQSARTKVPPCAFFAKRG
jgi:hypothetical protein